jgi:hypothetical protein
MQISKTLSILSAMITPAVLILACGSLVLATSQRLARVMDRTREISNELKNLHPDQAPAQSHSELYQILTLYLKRAYLLQRSLSSLYVGLSILIATSFSIGIIDLTNLEQVWVPVLLGMMGVFALLYSSLLLIQESKSAYDSIHDESELIIQMNRRFHSTRKKRRGKRILSRSIKHEHHKDVH